MVIKELRRKALKLFIFTLLLSAVQLSAGWQMGITYTNTGASGNTITANAYLGEDSAATNGWDWNFEIPLGPPPMNPSYVRIYFPHSDWGSYNGNYAKDIRAATPVVKTWNISTSANNPLSTAYMLSWVIPSTMPDYYLPKLLIGSSTINMRNQSSYSYTGVISTCSIRLDMNTGMPYLLDALPDMDFSSNLPQSLDLSAYFSVLSGSLSFSYVNNPMLVQSLIYQRDTVYWQVNPVQGFVGTTTATLNATGSGGTKTVAVNISRDATNSPPQYTATSPTLEILQNQQAVFSWADDVLEPDLDAVEISFAANADFSMVPDPVLEQVFVTPNPGYKGQGTVMMLLSDGVNPATQVEIAVTVLPSVPAAPANVQADINIQNELIINWSAVSSDISALPVSGVQYKVLCYSDPGFNLLLGQYITSDTELVIPGSAAQVFIKVIAINE